ncbi:carboxypeptidase-like regulatory domain-containing protein [Rickettsiales bacterium LUAb2]
MKFTLLIAICLLLFCNSLYGYSYNSKLLDLNPYIFLIVIKKNETNSTLIAYQDPKTNSFFIALDELVKVLDFNINVSGYSANGSFFDKTLNINLQKNIIKVNNKNIVYNKGDIIALNNRVYLSTELLQKIFDIAINANLQELKLNFDSKNLFPIEIRDNYMENRSTNLNNYKAKNMQKDTSYTMYNKLFSSPTLDLTLSQDYSSDQLNNSKQKSSYSSYNALFGGVFLGLDTNVYNSGNYNKNQNSDSYTNTTNLMFSKTYPSVMGNKPIKYFAFGDVQSTSTQLLDNGNSGRGIVISSLENYNINQNKTINLRGYLLPGWSVDLYYNNSLISYQTIADQNGYYNFNQVPVTSGVNEFKLVFYGPFGETRTETKRVVIGSSPVLQNEFAYTINILQNNRKIIENQKDKTYNQVLDNSINYNVNLYYGLLDNLALNISYLGVDTTNNGQFVNNYYNTPNYSKFNNFYNAGLIYSLYGITFENYIAGRTNYNKNASMFSAYGNIDYLGYVYASYQNFNNIQSNSSYDNNLLIHSLLDLRYNPSINIINQYFPVYIGYKEYKYETNSSNINIKQNIYSRVSYNIISNVSFTTEYNFDYTNQIEKQQSIKSIVLATYNNFRFNGYYQEQVTPNLYPNSTGAAVNYNFSNGFSTYAQFDKYFNYGRVDNFNNNTNYQFGISKVTSLGKLAISFNSNFKNQYEVNLLYNISFGYNTTSNKPYYEAETPLNNNGNIMANVFIDNDGTGVYNPKTDTPIKDAKLVINSASRNEQTDKNGTVHVNGLQSYNPSTISLDMQSLDDIMLVPKYNKYNVVLRPSMIQTLEFPLVRTSNIEGSIKFNKQACKFAKVKLIDKNSTFYQQTFTDDNGLFLIEKIPYGKYTLQANCKNTEQALTYDYQVSKPISYINVYAN